MSIDEELVGYDPDTVEGLWTILAALDAIRPQFESRKTWDLANRRTQNLARATGYPAPLLAAYVFREFEHPRGPDGRFIEKFSWVRWFDFDRRHWVRGKVMDVDKGTGEITVHRRLDKDNVGVYHFSNDQASKQLYSSPKPKASLDFPEVIEPGDNSGWRQIGEQGGFNPGGTYELDHNDGVQHHKWTDEELEFLLAGRPSVEVVGFVDDKEQFDDEDYSDRLKEKFEQTYPVTGGDGEGGAGVWEEIEGGRRSAGGVIIWDDPDGEGPQIAVVNRDHEHEQRPTPEGTWRADFALQNWVFRRIKAKLLPQNPERKLHPSWRRVIYGIGPDTGMGVGTPDIGVPRLPSLGKETAEGIAQSASQGVQTASEIRNAATGALVSLEDIIQADPHARLFPFEMDEDVLGNGDRLRALINAVVEPAVRPGDKFYIKDLSFNRTGPDWVANEIMAVRLYEMAGVPVPDVYQGNDASKIGSRIIGGELTDVREHLDDPEVMARVRSGFTVDSWLANWDVAGNEFDNIVIDEDGIPYRIDAGGALAYGGAGDRKGNMFGPIVGELETLGPDSEFGSSSNAPRMFEGLTHEEMVDGAQRIAGISPQQIRDLGLETGVEQNTVDMLIARRTYLIDQLLEGDDPFAGREMVNPEIGLEVVPEEDIVPEVPKANLAELDLREGRLPDAEVYENPVFSPAVPTEPDEGAPPVPGRAPIGEEAESDKPEIIPSITWNDAWTWSGETQQWVTDPEAQGPPTVDDLEGRWLDRVEELNGYIDQIEADGVVSAVMPASELVGSGALENSKAIVLMTDSLAVPGGRTDMFVPWGTDADGNAVLVSRISGQTVTPALEWADTRARVRAVDLTSVEEDFEEELDWIDGLATKAADAQVSLEASRTSYEELAAGQPLGWLRLENLGDDPVDLFILDGNRPVTSAQAGDGGLQLLDAVTGESIFFVRAAEVQALEDPEVPNAFFTRMEVTGPDDRVMDLVLPDMTGQQIIQAKLSMGILTQRAGLAEAAEVTAGFPQEDWVKPDPDLNAPDVAVDVRGSKPVPTGRLAGPAIADDWDYAAELELGTFIDTSGPDIFDLENPPEVHPGLPISVPIISSIDYEAASDDLIGQWVMHDLQGYRFTRQPVLVEEVLRDDDGILGINVTLPDGSSALLRGPGQSRLHIVEPPKEGRNIPALDSEIVLGHNGDIRIGKEVIGSWWHTDRNVSHRHTYGYMVEPQHTAHGKAVIGFRSRARAVRKQVRSEVWFADNYKDVEADSIPKGVGSATLEKGLKEAPAPGRLRGGVAWAPGQAVNKRRDWSSSDSQGVVVGGVHPNRPDLVYYREHASGTITMEDASELTAHGDEPEDALKSGGLFTIDGETYYVQQVLGNEVVAYSVSEGYEEVFGLQELPPVIDQPAPYGPIASYQGQFLEGALATPEARAEWEAVGGQFLADGEVPLPGSQVVDGAGQSWRVMRAGPDDLALISGAEVQTAPASQFRVDRAHYGGELGAIGQLKVRAYNGRDLDYDPALGDVLFVSPSTGEFRVLTATGEGRLFSLDDGHEGLVINTTEHGELMQRMFDGGDAYRVGVVLGGDNAVLISGDVEGTVIASRSDTLKNAGLGISGSNKSAKVVKFTESGVGVTQDPVGEGTDIVDLVQGAEPTGTYTPVLTVDETDMEWFPAPDTAMGPVGEAPPIPRITGDSSVMTETWDVKTFPMAENEKSLAEAVASAWAGANFEPGVKTVHQVQFDHGAVEDFVVQVMPVRDSLTGEEYTELFFRPLEGHAAELYNSLVAPAPDETLGEWRFPDDADDIAPENLAMGQMVALRRGPHGRLVGWGHEGEFATGQVISDARQIGNDDQGRALHEFDVMLPNGTTATVIQDNAMHWYQPVEWMVADEGGFRPIMGPGGRRPTQLAPSARDAGWKLTVTHLGSQVKHNTNSLDPDGVKVIDTNAAHFADDYAERQGMGSGATFQRTINGTKIWTSLSRPRPQVDEEQNNFGRQVYIQVPRSQAEDPEAMARAVSGAMEAVGITPEMQSPPTRESMETWALNTIGQSFGANPEFQRQMSTQRLPRVGPLQPGRSWTRDDIDQLLAEEVSPKVGREVTLADFEFAVDPDGRLMVVTSNQLANELAEHSGYLSVRHETDLTWSPLYAEDGARAVGAEVARTLGAGKVGDNIGPASRAAIGNWTGGQSSDTDMHNGTGNRFYGWTHDADPPEVRDGGGFDILYDGVTFQRFLGNGMATEDNHGRRTSAQGGFPLQSWTSKPGITTDHNEATIKYGLDASLVEVITVPDELYPGVLETVRGYGVEQVDGRPIEEIIQPASRMISMTERRRARQARPNNGFFPVVGNVAQILAGEETAPAPELELPPAQTPLEPGIELVEMPVSVPTSTGELSSSSPGI